MFNLSNYLLQTRQPLAHFNIKILAMNLLLCLLLIAFTHSASDTLLTLGRSHSCIKEVISEFVRADNCTLLLDPLKTKLAIMMSKCLLSSMGKPFPSECDNSITDCKLEGDAWSTFTTFYAHIDNLCHFYWEVLHHERAERIIVQLSQSSSNAQKVIRQNVEQTHKILTMQQKMHVNLQQSLRNQNQMAILINDSAVHIKNITHHIQTFVQRLQEDINQNYASLRVILGTVNEGIIQVTELQGYLKAEITTINGMVYFLIQFLLILFITSFEKEKNNRNKLLFILTVQIALQLAILRLIYALIGIKFFRCGFAILMVTVMIKSNQKKNQIQAIMLNQLNTPRLERAFAKVIERNRFQQFKKKQIYLQLSQKSKLQDRLNNKMIQNEPPLI